MTIVILLENTEGHHIAFVIQVSSKSDDEEREMFLKSKNVIITVDRSTKGLNKVLYESTCIRNQQTFI